MALIDEAIAEAERDITEDTGLLSGKDQDGCYTGQKRDKPGITGVNRGSCVQYLAKGKPAASLHALI